MADHAARVADAQHPAIERCWDGTPAALSEAHLTRYLERLGVERPTAPTAAAAREIQLAHLYAIPFENLSTMFGVPVELDHDTLVAKMLSGTRGGYCYEHNMLFAGALVALGYGVQMHAARSLFGVVEGPLARTHVALAVTPDDGEARLFDVGFGRSTLTSSLPLTPGEVVTVGADRYRVMDQDGELAVQSSRAAGPWASLYLMDPRPIYPIDITMANHFVSTHPNSPMGIRVVVLQPTPLGKRSLSGRHLVIDEADRPVVSREISAAELPDVLRAEFGIVLPEPLRELPA